LYVRPTGPLRKQYSDDIAQLVDPFIEETGGLAGLVLEVVHFPGWENPGAAARHFRFVRDHHTWIKKIALITDLPVGAAAEHIVSHFMAAEIKQFPSDGLEAAMAWIGSN
jgi:hypothetical protein